MGATEKLARFVVDTRYEDIPEEVKHIARRLILDCIGTMLVGSEEPQGKIATRFVRECGGAPEASVIHSGFKTCPANAAFANGIMGHALDYDDTRYWGHPSVTMVPTLLALGEKLAVPGKELLAAYILGIEVYGRIGFGSTHTSYLRGWHHTAIFGAMGSAAVAARLLKLDVPRTRCAFGIAATEASGLRQNFGTMTKPFHAGHAARSGIVAAMLARDGFTADASIIENPLGYGNVILGAGEWDGEKMTRNLGNPFLLASPAPGMLGPSIKIYPCCGGMRSHLDAMFQVMAEHNLTFDDIEEVICDTDMSLLKVLIHSEPETGLEGKFSLQYTMASAIADGRITLNTYTDESINRPGIKDALKKIKLNVYPVARPMDEDIVFPITVRLKDGKTYHKVSEIPKGSPGAPLTRDELLAKFRDCARHALAAEQIERVINIVEQLEKQPDIAELAKILVR